VSGLPGRADGRFLGPDERGRGLTPVDCRECGTTVLCEKFSAAHTSTQWTEDAERVCPEVRSGLGACRRLRAAIDRAVAAGELTVLEVDGSAGANR
jgi:uncharacterized protein YbbK (DUF523 family)